MKLRQAEKIMRNVRLYPVMHWVYGYGRVGKANRICIHHYARVSPVIKMWNVFMEKDSLSAIRVLNEIIKSKKN